MKGIVFTEFLELVEAKFGLETVDEIIEKSNLPSKGAYTSIGTYDFSEMIALISNLSEKTNLTIDELLYVYSLHFFSVLERDYSMILKTYKNPMELLSSVESHIHVEVRKIYPDAELPRFEIKNQTKNKLELIYYSSRSMYAFAHGLIEKTFEHYGTSASVSYQKIKEDGSEVKFVILENE
ncbi:heme NO-binding domain-containing protein [Pseudotenacibaculum sp. MALMAid0570]|mgnify:CR=1 FL=1|uniref:heme NO-binding domain-containing protein n=1 Tax=Pseudotenacibaculum sp. MALMAid0570 TaxID=3143938 RepID=UPI0032E02699